MSMSQRNIVPYFSKQDNVYGNYEGLSVDDFSSKVEVYFYDREPDPDGIAHFRVDYYIDILEAPYHVLNAKYNNTFIYNPLLAEHFFKLFPTAVNFQEQLLLNFSSVSNSLDEMQGEYPSKKPVLEKISQQKKLLATTFQKLHSLPGSIKNDSYVEAAINYAKSLESELSDFYDIVELTPEDQIKYNYYLKIPFESWVENPLAFFINLLYGSGLQKIINEFEQDIFYNPYGDAKRMFLDSVLKNEAIESFTHIKEKIKSIFTKKAKQVYIDEICAKLKKLNDRSEKHIISTLPSSHAVPYKFIASNIKRHYSTKFLITIDFDIAFEENLPIVYKPIFLKRLLALKIPNNDGSLMPLCNKEITASHFVLFMRGKLSDLPKIYFHWPSRAIYYLLRKLKENDPSFRINALERKPLDRAKVFMCDGLLYQGDCSPFRCGNYYTYISEHSDENGNLTIKYPEIDDIF
jgi:hypothetical protein